MSFQIKHAMSVPFSGKNWFLKLSIGIILICLMPILILLFGKNIFVALSVLFIAVIPFGYTYISVHNELNNETVILPSWDIIKCFGTLLRILVIKLAYAIPLFPVAFGIAYLYLKVPVLKIIAIILGIIVILIYSAFIFFAECSFLKNYKFKEAFNFSRNINLMQVGYGKYIVAILWSFIVGLLLAIPLGIVISIIMLLLMGIIQALGINSFEAFALIKGTQNNLCNFFGFLIGLNLSAQAYKMAERELDKEKFSLQRSQ